MSEQNSIEKVGPVQGQPLAPVTVPAYTVDLEQEEALSLLEYLRVLRKRRWTVISLLLLVVFTVMIGTLKQRPVYRATVVLQVDRENPNILTFEDFVGEIGQFDDSFLETAYKLLQSRTLASRVIDELKLEDSPEFQSKPSWLDHYWNGSQPRPEEEFVEGGQLSSVDQDVIENFLDQLTISPVRRSRLVEVSFDSYEPQLSARVVNLC